MFRLNSLGLVSNELPALWQAWWSVGTSGRAVALLQYCSGLMYFDGENPLFDAWTPDAGGGGPYLWENDSNVYDRGWPAENVEFLRVHVTSDRVAQAVRDAAAALRNEPEGDVAAQIAAELDDRVELIASRVAELPSLLASPGTQGWQI